MHLGKCGINYSAGLNQKRYFLITSLKKTMLKVRQTERETKFTVN